MNEINFSSINSRKLSNFQLIFDLTGIVRNCIIDDNVYNITCNITSARLSFRLGVPFGESSNSFFCSTGGYDERKIINALFLSNIMKNLQYKFYNFVFM